MRTSILLLVLASIMSIFAAGCASTPFSPNIAFGPRAYPYLPELGADGPASAGLATK
jgi:hypothetical protein